MGSVSLHIMYFDFDNYYKHCHWHVYLYKKSKHCIIKTFPRNKIFTELLSGARDKLAALIFDINAF